MTLGHLGERRRRVDDVSVGPPSRLERHAERWIHRRPIRTLVGAAALVPSERSPQGEVRRRDRRTQIEHVPEVGPALLVRADVDVGDAVGDRPELLEPALEPGARRAGPRTAPTSGPGRRAASGARARRPCAPPHPPVRPRRRSRGADGSTHLLRSTPWPPARRRAVRRRGSPRASSLRGGSPRAGRT